MRVLVLGAKGMLGRYVSTYLESTGKYRIIRDYKTSEFGTQRLIEATDTPSTIWENLHAVIERGDVIINCIGTIKPRIDHVGELNSILVNSVFPRNLADVCESLHVKLIHPTTDCVFSGEKGFYSEEDPHDVTDIYGRTKSLGEPNNCTVIRTSIIGEEVNQKRSLVEWVKSNKGGKISGYTNHIWNGVTCLQFAKICEDIIDHELYWDGVRHLFSDNVSKYELLTIINRAYQLNITISPVEAEQKCDRTLSTIHPPLLTKMIPPLYMQIFDMKDFSDMLYNKK